MQMAKMEADGSGNLKIATCFQSDAPTEIALIYSLNIFLCCFKGNFMFEQRYFAMCLGSFG